MKKIFLTIIVSTAVGAVYYIFLNHRKIVEAVNSGSGNIKKITYSKNPSPKEKAFIPLKKDEVRTMLRGQGAKNIRKCAGTDLVKADIHSLESEIKGFQSRHFETGKFSFGELIKQVPNNCDQPVKNCDTRTHGGLGYFIASQFLIQEDACPNGGLQLTYQLVKLESICLDGVDYLTGIVKNEQLKKIPEKCTDLKKPSKIVEK